MKIHRKISLSLALAALASFGASALSVRDLKYEITDTAIVFPESQQVDVHKMQQNWYLQNYTVLQEPNADAVEATDQVITERLAAIPTTIEMPFNQVVRTHVDLYANRRRSLVETMLGLSLYYMPIFEEALEREGLPLELRNLPIIESALNPDAVSRAGATGLWQIMLATARGLGLEVNTLVDERRDPLASTDAAVRFLKQLYGIYGDWSLAIAAYNCGPGNVNKALTRAGASADNPKDFWDIYYYLPAETRGYVPAFIGATYAMEYYPEHGISPALAKRPILTDTIHVKSRIHFNAISKVLDIPVEELKTLNPQYRQGIIPGDLKQYALRLPSQTIYNYLLFEDSIKAESARLAPRTTVEIGGSNTVTDSDGATYKEVTKWHKVRRGETVSQVARKYGVTSAQVKRWNGLKSNKLRSGTSIKIITRQRVAVPAPTKTPEQVDTAKASSSFIPQAETSTEEETVDENETREIEVEESSDGADFEETVIEINVQPAQRVADPAPKQEAKTQTETQTETQPTPAPAQQTPKAKNKHKSITHKVRKGETLYSISKKYGVSVEQIQKNNNLSGSTLKVDQRLTIPQK